MAEHNRKTVKHVTRSKNTKKSEGEIKKADVIRVIVCAVPELSGLSLFSLYILHQDMT